MEKKDADFWSVVRQIITMPGVRIRVKLRAQQEPLRWGSTLIEPVQGYIEPQFSGPVLKHDIEWIEIDPRVMRKAGKLLPEKVTDLSSEISGLLKQNGFSFENTTEVFRLLCPTQV